MENKIRTILRLLMICLFCAAGVDWGITKSTGMSILLATFGGIVMTIQAIPPFVDDVVDGLLQMKKATELAKQNLYKLWRNHSSCKNILILFLVVILIASIEFNVGQWHSSHTGTPASASLAACPRRRA